jgi:hypothetical protein
VVYDWQQDPEWGDDDGEKKALLLIILATLCVGVGMVILWHVAASLP